jgi:hypothetical protein
METIEKSSTTESERLGKTGETEGKKSSAPMPAWPNTHGSFGSRSEFGWNFPRGD